MLQVESNSLGKDLERSGRLNRIWGLRGLEPAFPSPYLFRSQYFYLITLLRVPRPNYNVKLRECPPAPTNKLSSDTIYAETASDSTG